MWVWGRQVRWGVRGAGDPYAAAIPRLLLRHHTLYAKRYVRHTHLFTTPVVCCQYAMFARHTLSPFIFCQRRSVYRHASRHVANAARRAPRLCPPRLCCRLLRQRVVVARHAHAARRLLSPAPARSPAPMSVRPPCLMFHRCSLACAAWLHRANQLACGIAQISTSLEV